MYEKIEQMIYQSEKFDKDKFDENGKLSDLSFTSDGCKFKNQNFSISTEEIFRQLFTLLRHEKEEIKYSNQFWKFYNSPTTKFSISYLLNSLIEAFGDKKILIRFYKDEPRAILSGHYQDFSNTKILERLQSRISHGGISDYILPRCWLSPDNLVVNVVGKNEYGVREGNELVPYGSGIGLKNNEVGSGAFHIGALLWRTKCLNSLRFTEVSKYVHKGIKEWMILNHIDHSISSAFSSIGNYLEGIEALSKIPVGDLNKEIENLTSRFPTLISFPKKDNSIKETILLGTENQSTILGVVNGITWLAQSLNDSDPNHAYALEVAAGELFNQELEKIQVGER